MPTAETLERFIARVEENAHVEALEEFYTADSTMQENQSPPRVGCEASIANERLEATSRAVTWFPRAVPARGFTTGTAEIWVLAVE